KKKREKRKRKEDILLFNIRIHNSLVYNNKFINSFSIITFILRQTRIQQYLFSWNGKHIFVWRIILQRLFKVIDLIGVAARFGFFQSQPVNKGLFKFIPSQ